MKKEEAKECCTVTYKSATVQHFLLPCPFKKITGWDCPGCGFQRSTIAFVKGNYQESFTLYPAMLPLYLLFISAIIFRYFPGKRKEFLLKVFIYFCGCMSPWQLYFENIPGRNASVNTRGLALIILHYGLQKAKIVHRSLDI